MAQRDGGYLLVAALDLGTTYSGYAFSFITDPENVICNNNWGEEYGFKSHKTPTSILTNSAGNFIAMGYNAEQRYSAELEEKGTPAGLHLYRNFKMSLHKPKNVTMKTAISSEDGTIRPAVDIFGFAIAYLKNHAMDMIKTKADISIRPSSIFWVITVPAIWSEPAKKFMREAALKGGCVTSTDDNNLLLALEPEAASMCCRRPKMAGYLSSDGLSFPPNTIYLMLDCGGGTVDITAHKTLKDDTIEKTGPSGGSRRRGISGLFRKRKDKDIADKTTHKTANNITTEEILPASGGPWGGINVNKEFMLVLDDIFGKDFLNRYRSVHPQGWVELLNSFESTKKPFNGEENNSLRISIPWSFGEFHTKAKHDKTIKTTIEEFGNPEIAFINGSIIVKNTAAKRLFSPALSKISTHVEDLLKDPKLKDCRYIFMVGGFSESRLLQDEVKKRFERNGINVVIPAEAQLAVLKGAVLFGHFPTEIKARIARKTYGYGINDRFDAKIHDPKRKITLETGEEKCEKVFVPLVKQGDSVPVGHEITRTSYPQSKNVTSSHIRIFCKDGQPDHPVQYTDSPGVEYIGKVVTEHPPCNHRKANQKTNIFTFGSTELYVRVIHVATGNEFTSSFGFASDPSID